MALCLDGNQRELIAFGKGIGFKPIPYELTDLSVIERTYYGISPEYQGLLKEIPKEIFDVSGMLVDLAANSIDADFNRNLVITLADHINFAIDRYKKNINIKPPTSATWLTCTKQSTRLPPRLWRASTSASVCTCPKKKPPPLRCISSTPRTPWPPEGRFPRRQHDDQRCHRPDRKGENITIDRSGFNASRFITHMEYLLARIRNNETLKTTTTNSSTI